MRSYTFTKQELINIIRPTIKHTLTGMIDDFIAGNKHVIRVFEDWQDIENRNNDQLIQWWSDNFSEDFFKNNPDIDDVLLLLEKGSNNCPSIKIWMASNI